MRNRDIRWVILLGAIAVLSIIAMQSYWLIQRWTHESQSFHQTTSIALLKVAKKLAEFNKSTLPSGEIIKRITPNYYIVNFNDVIDANILQHFLHEEFSALANYIDDYTDSQYVLYDCSSADMVYVIHRSLFSSNTPHGRTVHPPQYDQLLYYLSVQLRSRGQALRTN